MKACLLTSAILLTLLIATSYVRGDEASLSFKSIKQTETLNFQASTWPKDTDNTHRVGLMIFNVKIKSYPEPKAIIELGISSATNLPLAEKLWGHGINEPVQKILTKKDISNLDSFITSYQAQGVADPSNLKDARGWMRFTISNTTFLDPSNKALGFSKSYSYHLSPALDAEFIRTFVGMN